MARTSSSVIGIGSNPQACAMVQRRWMVRPHLDVSSVAIVVYLLATSLGPGESEESGRSSRVHLVLVGVPPLWINQRGCWSSTMSTPRQTSWLRD